MKSKTEIDERFEYRNDKRFALEMLIGMVVSFLVGTVIATGIIMLCLSITYSW
ncbi:MAG: hypothetical protein KW793_03865 [Candidatus Doudnabacteria bacterium]|nr:hypothetical protein [Candidatus Doudnabacteria bacterium]